MVFNIDFSEYLQSEESECGLMCVAASAAFLGRAITAAEARRNFSGSIRGASIQRLSEVAENLNMMASAVSCSSSELRELTLPAILHWNEKHFVLLTKIGSRYFQIFDPAIGSRSIAVDELERSFSGSAIQLERALDFKRTSRQPAIRFGPLLLAAKSVRWQIARLLGLSFVMQLLALLLPLLMQLAINLGAMEGDVQAVGIVAAGIALVYVSNFFVETWRGLINQRIAAEITQVTARSMFRHLLAVPMSWLERRSVADVATRFDSIEPLRNALSSGLATLLIDGSLGILLAVVLFFMSPILAGVTLGSIAVAMLFKLAFSPFVSRYASEAASHRIVEQAKRWETIRSAQSLKLAGAESIRERDWASRLKSQTFLLEKSQAFASTQQSMANLVGGLGGLLVIYVGAVMVSKGDLSVGGLFAFVMYRRYLSDKLSGALDQINNLWMLRIHLTRISELFEVEQEPRWNDTRSAGEYLREGAISLRGVYYRHSPSDRMILNGVSLDVAAGEMIIINGPSGAGKSTLLRLIAGLYAPSGGDILFDGVSQASIAPRLLRSNLGVVMQEDELLSGTIFENVTMFNERPKLELCIEALEAAEIWHEIQKLTLGIHTSVGEGGRLLSAGQRQRILLARALYRQPRILILDEATSNVDPVLEKRIFSRLKQLQSTKIIVSHHQGLNEFADKVVLIDHRGLKVPGRIVHEVSI